jgi:hypothetical protein
MRTRWLALVLVAVCVSTLTAQQFTYKKTSAEITVAAAAIALFTSADIVGTAGHPAATLATCSLLGANIRVSWDGVDPTTNLGEVLTPGVYTVAGNDVMSAMKGIRDDSTSATWSCVVMAP